MDKECQFSKKVSFWLATGIGLFILLFFGFEYRVISNSLLSSTSEKSAISGTLSLIPMAMGNWRGQDVPLDGEVVQALAVDDYINRSYARYAGTETVELFITCGERVRDLMPHRPEVCYPGNGWTLRGSEKKLLRMEDGWSFECNILYFDRGGLSDKTMTVLNYYVVDGAYVPDLSAVRSTLWQDFKSLEYMLQVQVACESTLTYSTEAAADLSIAFALESAHAIRAILPDKKSSIVASML
jgi:EpsI family protein